VQLFRGARFEYRRPALEYFPHAEPRECVVQSSWRARPVAPDVPERRRRASRGFRSMPPRPDQEQHDARRSAQHQAAPCRSWPPGSARRLPSSASEARNCGQPRATDAQCLLLKDVPVTRGGEILRQPFGLRPSRSSLLNDTTDRIQDPMRSGGGAMRREAGGCPRDRARPRRREATEANDADRRAGSRQTPRQAMADGHQSGEACVVFSRLAGCRPRGSNPRADLLRMEGLAGPCLREPKRQLIDRGWVAGLELPARSR